MGMAAILVIWLGPFEQTFVPPSQRSSIWNLTLIDPMVSEEKMFKECGRRTDDGRRRPTYPISSPMSLRLRWAKTGLILTAYAGTCTWVVELTECLENLADSCFSGIKIYFRVSFMNTTTGTSTKNNKTDDDDDDNNKTVMMMMVMWWWWWWWWSDDVRETTTGTAGHLLIRLLWNNTVKTRTVDMIRSAKTVASLT